MTVQGLTILLIFYEAIQFIKNPGYYFSDFWNIFDLTGFFSLSAYCIFVESEIEFENRKDLLGFGLLVIFWRGISYLRPFHLTRHLVGMIVEIIKDMSSFFIVLIYSLIALAFI